MRALRRSSASILLAQIAVLFMLLFVEHTSSAESTAASSESEAGSPCSNSAQGCSRHKRAPGWGKRNSLDLYGDSESTQDLMNSVAALKRAPGWGKRFSAMGAEEKRAPGWGKRSELPLVRFDDDGLELDDESLAEDKRAPGWGKRAPGWGKRAPGWGKRAPGWGKRAPGWGKRSSDDFCQQLDSMVDDYISKAIEVDSQRIAYCGNAEEPNEPSRK